MIKKIIKSISIIASIWTIISVILLFVDNPKFQVIALSFFCLTLLSIIVVIIYNANRYFKYCSDNEFITKTASFIYKTKDNKIIDFETLRIIQCKRSWADKFEWNFKWSGNQEPIFDSVTHPDIKVSYNKDKQVFDKAIVEFKNPTFYNETIPIQFKTRINDPQKTSEPFLATRVKTPIDLITFSVFLSYKRAGYDKQAVLYRHKDHGTGHKETIAYCDFNQSTKSYECFLHKPEIGYTYRLEWER